MNNTNPGYSQILLLAARTGESFEAIAERAGVDFSEARTDVYGDQRGDILRLLWAISQAGGRVTHAEADKVLAAFGENLMGPIETLELENAYNQGSRTQARPKKTQAIAPLESRRGLRQSPVELIHPYGTSDGVMVIRQPGIAGSTHPISIPVTVPSPERLRLRMVPLQDIEGLQRAVSSETEFMGWTGVSLGTAIPLLVALLLEQNPDRVLGLAIAASGFTALSVIFYAKFRQARNASRAALRKLLGEEPE